MIPDSPLIRSLRAAVRAHPDDVPLRLHLAQLLLDAGKTDDAVAHVAAALHRRPNSVEARALMARAMADRSGTGPVVPAVPRRASGDEPTERYSFNWIAAERQFLDTTQPRLFELTLPRLLDTGVEPAPTPPPAPPPPPPPPAPPTYEPQPPRLRLADVGGLAEVRRRLETLVLAPARHVKPPRRPGRQPRGAALLYGPDGCGKTLLARAVAGELGASFLPVSLPEVLGHPAGADRVVRELVGVLRRAAPCVLLLDDVDAVGQHVDRHRTSGAAPGAVNRWLSELDGVLSFDGVLVLAAAGRPWEVAAPLRRPGRLDRLVLVPPPDSAAREAILRQHLRGRPLHRVKVADLARRTVDYSAVDLVRLCEAAIGRAELDRVRTGRARLIDGRDFEVALAEVGASTGGWLAEARNVAVFANADGSYTDLHRYLRRRRMV